MTYTVNKKNTIFYYIAIASTALLLAFFYYNTIKGKSTEKWVEHTQKVIDKNDEILVDIINIETGVRGFLLTKKETFLAPYYESQKTINRNLESLLRLTNNNPNQKRRVLQLKKSIAERIELSKLLININNNNNKEVELAGILKGKKVMDAIRQNIKAINLEELSLLKKQKRENTFSSELSQILLYALFFLLLILVFFIYYLFKNHNKRNSELELFNKHQTNTSQYCLSLIEASRDPLFTISPDGKITDTNQATVNATDVSKENLIGSDFIIYFTEPEKAKKSYEEVFSKGFVVDYPLTIKDHKLTDVLFNGSVYTDINGNIVGAVVVARDITAQKKAEKELIEAKVFAELATEIAEQEKNKAEFARKIAVDAVKAKQQFLSNMSHEIRTPMNAIIGFTKVVLKTDLSAKQKEYLSAIKISGDALIVLINDILDLAKVDAGKMVFEKVPFKLQLSIKALLHIFETKIQEKNLELVTQYDTNIPEVLLGDPVRLHQIISNLVSNAIKFTSEGIINVKVQLLNENEEKATVEFEVSDTGIGISEEKLGGIFENFQQASSNTSRLYGGTGLGLAIVKQLVEPQGGTITVKSKVGAGSSFSFILDFPKTNDEAEIDTEIIEMDPENKNIKVLVVEDMALNQLLMKTVLDDFGFERDIAENGQIAIDKLKTKLYDIVLMDLQMPVLNGFEATNYIRKAMNSKIPIIALTADVTTVDLVKCKAVGMNDYIAKPVDERLLYSKIIGLVKKPTLEKRNKSELNGTAAAKKEKCIDLNYLNKLTKANPQLMMEMISLYLAQTPPIITAMKQSLLDKDFELLHASMHKMIPSFSIMGISPEFEEIARKIQEYSGSQQFIERIDALASELEVVCAQACKELEIEYNLLKNTLS
jgi:PAS domain S-box-containing protein